MAIANIEVGNIYQNKSGGCRKVLKLIRQGWFNGVIYADCDSAGIPKGKQKTAALADFMLWAHILLAPLTKKGTLKK